MNLAAEARFLHLEAYEIIRKDENPVQKLSPFMIQVLAFWENESFDKRVGMRTRLSGGGHEKSSKQRIPAFLRCLWMCIRKRWGLRLSAK